MSTHVNSFENGGPEIPLPIVFPMLVHLQTKVGGKEKNNETKKREKKKNRKRKRFLSLIYLIFVTFYDQVFVYLYVLYKKREKEKRFFSFILFIIFYGTQKRNRDRLQYSPIPSKRTHIYFITLLNLVFGNLSQITCQIFCISYTRQNKVHFFNHLILEKVTRFSFILFLIKSYVIAHVSIFQNKSSKKIFSFHLGLI